MKIMITGGAGFVGSHLAEFLLKKRHEIIVCTKTTIKNVENIFPSSFLKYCFKKFLSHLFCLGVL